MPARRARSAARGEDHLAPNESRNLALAHVETPYVVFIDNDVFVQPGYRREDLIAPRAERRAI